MAVYSGGTILKRTADGREVLSDSIDTVAGEKRLGAYLNLEGKPLRDGVTLMTPHDGPYTDPTEVVFTGTFTNTAGNYAIQLVVDDAFVLGPIDSLDSPTQITATVPAGSDTDGLVSGPGSATVRLAVRTSPGHPFVALAEPQSWDYT